MLKKEIKYEDFNGDEVTEVFYFNISKNELIELEVEYKDGLADALQRIIKSDDRQRIIKEFKRIILFAYGEKSADGKRFVKNDQVREDFSHTAAYQALFMELATQADAAATFLKGVLPKDLGVEVDKAVAETATESATPPIRSV